MTACFKTKDIVDFIIFLMNAEEPKGTGFGKFNNIVTFVGIWAVLPVGVFGAPNFPSS
jgi:hypothetical protein